MNKPDENKVSYRILVDSRHGTYYYVEPNGKSHIKTNNQFSGKGEKKCFS